MASGNPTQNGASRPVDPGIMSAQPGVAQNISILGRVNNIKGLLLLVLMDGKSQGLSGLCYFAQFQRFPIKLPGNKEEVV